MKKILLVWGTATLLVAAPLVLRVRQSGSKPQIGSPLAGFLGNTSGLRAAWMFNERGGAKLYDASGHGNAATIQDTTDIVWQFDRFGNSVLRGNRVYPSAVKIATPALSMAVPWSWEGCGELNAFPVSPSGGYTAMYTDDGGNTGIYVMSFIYTTNESVLNMFYSSADHNGTISVTPGGTLGQWHCYAVTAQTNLTSFYVDGKFDTSFASTVPTWTVVGLLDDHTLDGSSYPTGWDGQYGFQTVWSRVRTLDEIADVALRALSPSMNQILSAFSRFLLPTPAATGSRHSRIINVAGL